MTQPDRQGIVPRSYHRFQIETMKNDLNYTVLSSLTPTPTPEEIVNILVVRDFKSIAGLSRTILTSHTAINRVLAGENLPAVRREIVKALGLSFNPWDDPGRDSILTTAQIKSHQNILENIAYD